MAETAGDIVKDALKEVVALGSEATIEPVDAQDAVRYLNRMMAALDAEGIDLGYTEATGLGSTLTSPAGASEAMVALLAIRLWNQYSPDQPLPTLLTARAANGMKTLLHIAVTIGATEYPDTLPIGSGNEGDAHRTSHFYEDLLDTILAETSGSVGLEGSTT